MVTMAQINRLDSRIDELVDKLNPTPRITYDVRLVWLQDDGSVVDDDGNPYVQRPGDIRLEFTSPRQ
jgi:hypothetical protein